MHVYQLSIFFLGSASACCLLGLASPRFHDNLFMCAGMCALGLGAAWRVVDLAQMQPEEIPWDWFFVHAGIGLFALGITFDAFLKERRRLFVTFAQSTFERLQGWPAAVVSRFEVTQHPIVSTSAAKKVTKR